MKTCPVCGATYTSRISFCFEDGAILVAGNAMTPDALPSDTPSASGVSHRVPSRVATPVSPARRGRSLLSGKGSSLSFSPPRAVTAPPMQQRAQGPDLSPAPLLPLTIPEEDEEGELETYAAPPVPTTEPPPPEEEPAAPDEHTPTPPPVARTETTPTPVGSGGPVTPSEDEALSTYDDLDFPEWEPYDEEEEEGRRVIPPWLIPVAAVAGVLVIIGGAVVGATLGLIGSGALEPVDGTELAAPPAATEPELAPEPTAPATTSPAITDVEPAAPDATASTEPEPDPTVSVEPDPGTEPETEPAGEEPGTSSTTEEASTPTTEESRPPETLPVSTITTDPEGTSEVDEGSPWGTIEVRSSSAQITSVPPGAEVLMDGDRIGVTPLDKDIAYGVHAFELRLDGYEGASQSVTVDSPQLALPFELTALARSGAVIVVLEGWDGATLFVDGEKAGVLPARIQISEGSHDFKVESPSGTQSVTRDVVLSDSGVTIVNLSG
jgi:hypothetical protein